MLKKLLICFSFIFFIYSVSAKSSKSFKLSKAAKTLKPEFRLFLDFNSSPFFYEHTYNLYSTCFNGTVMGGVTIGKFTIGIEATDNYYSFDGQNSDNHFIGAWNILRGSINGYFNPIHWFELKWGVGGAWYRSAFKLNDGGIKAKNEPGVSALLDTTFSPSKYFSIKLFNRVDVFFDGLSVSPYYYGGADFIFHPFVEWLDLYVEAGGMPWFYNGEPATINTGIFVWTVGVSLDIVFLDSVRKTKEAVAVIKKKKLAKAEKKAFQNNVNKIDELEKAKKGDSVVFSNILFYSDSYKIKEESFGVLNSIARVLVKRQDLNLDIIGHTNSTGNPKAELSLSIKRARMVRDYLSERGVSRERMNIFGYGSRYSSKNKTAESNRKVEFKLR